MTKGQSGTMMMVLIGAIMVVLTLLATGVLSGGLFASFNSISKDQAATDIRLFGEELDGLCGQSDDQQYQGYVSQEFSADIENIVYEQGKYVARLKEDAGNVSFKPAVCQRIFICKRGSAYPCPEGTSGGGIIIPKDAGETTLTVYYTPADNKVVIDPEAVE